MSNDLWRPFGLGTARTILYLCFVFAKYYTHRFENPLTQRNEELLKDVNFANSSVEIMTERGPFSKEPSPRLSLKTIAVL